MSDGRTPELARIKALRRFALSISVLTILGHTWLGFEQSYATPLVAVGVAYAAELGLHALDATLQHQRPRYLASTTEFVDFLLPAHITGLACAMLLYPNERISAIAFASGAGIASKYLFRVRVKGVPRHVLNPSNTGITATLLLFPWVGIAPPYQFTENVRGIVSWIIPLAILTAGTLLNAKLTRKMPLIAGWLLGFVAQAALRSMWGDAVFVAALLPLTGVAFILFTNYMITDPGSTPTAPRRQFAFGACTAAVYGLLVAGHVSFGLFFALTIACVGRGVALALWNIARRTLTVAELARRRVPTVPRPAEAPAEVAAVAEPVGSRS